VVVERQVAEVLRTWATDPDPVVARSSATRWPSRPTGSMTSSTPERDREPEENFGDSWRTYWEHADHIHQIYDWKVPQPPPRAMDWLPLGRDD
jgi:hypothetical protein